MLIQHLTRHSTSCFDHTVTRVDRFRQPPSRTFTTTLALSGYKQIQRIKGHGTTPTYPHGPAQWYKKSDKGLYGGARIRFGNIVSKGKWVKKTRRYWKPNVRSSSLYSEGLDKQLKLKVTARVLRTIDKVGGLDKYLLGNSSTRIKELGMKGWQLRWRLMQTDKVSKDFAERQEQLGMSPDMQRASQTQRNLMKSEFTRATRGPTPQFLVKRKRMKSRQDIWDGRLLEGLKNLAITEVRQLSRNKIPRASIRPRYREKMRVQLMDKIMNVDKPKCLLAPR